MMDCYLGVDIGTTSAKLLACLPDGTILLETSAPYPTHHPQSDYSEQDPDAIFQTLISLFTIAADQLTTYKIAFISFSAAMHSLMAVDSAGRSLTRLWIWSDRRATAIADELRRSASGKSIHEQTGVPIHPMSPLCKLLWMRKYEPELFNTAYKFIGIKEYIIYQFTKEYVIDTSLASATGLLNLHSLNWNRNSLQLTNISTDKLSTLVSPTASYPLVQAPAGLQTMINTPLVIGASDGALAAFNSGDSLSLTIGTSAAVRKLITTPDVSSSPRTFCYHVHEHIYVTGSASNNGAVVLEWLSNSLFEEDLQTLLIKAMEAPPGSDGLLCLPFLLGERSPAVPDNMQASWFNIRQVHTKNHFVRSCLEGILFHCMRMAELVYPLDSISDIKVSGGFSKTKEWLQVTADVFNKPIYTGIWNESAGGAIVIGAKARGLPLIQASNKESIYHPNEENQKIYRSAYAKFLKVIDVLREVNNHSTLIPELEIKHDE